MFQDLSKLEWDVLLTCYTRMSGLFEVGKIGFLLQISEDKVARVATSFDKKGPGYALVSGISIYCGSAFALVRA